MRLRRVLLLLVPLVLPAAAAAGLSESFGRLPLQFEQNRGQVDREVRFLARGPGYGLYLTASEAVLALGSKDRAVLRMALVGARPDAQVRGLEELPGKANYFIGRDSSKWRTNVPTYAKVRYREVYPGIDLVYYGNQRQLEYDFVVAPGADAEKILLRFEGTDAIRVDAQGHLVLRTANGELRQHKPVVYQEVEGIRQEIEGGYVIKDANRVGFKVAAYDASEPLVIDPVLVYSTYLGGTNYDYGHGIAIDSAGSAYVVGYTHSIDFPTPAGPSGTGVATVYVAKLNPSGTAIVYCSFLGDGFGNAIAIDAGGNAHVAGIATSANFPTTPGAFRTTYSGSWDAFVAKLDATGSALLYSTLLGGGSFDYGNGIALDDAGYAFVTGAAASTDFPTTAGAFQTSGSGAFVSKINPAGSALIYSTYLNGGAGNGIAVDASGNAFVTGYAYWSTFPTTAGAFQPGFGGGPQDAFVAKLNATGSALAYSTFLGGIDSDAGKAIAVDGSGSAYVAGDTLSTNFPTTLGAYQLIFGGGNSNVGGDAFVTKLDPSGVALVYSTYLGGNHGDGAGGIAVDGAGNVHIVGSTYSINFPVTPGAIQYFHSNKLLMFPNRDAFVTKFHSTGAFLLYSTFLGGPDGVGWDIATSLAIDAHGNIYVTGHTESPNFPTTPGAFQPDLSRDFSGYDAFIAKIGEDAPSPTGPSTRFEESAASYTGYWPTYGPETGNFSGGAIRASNQATATATFTFTGTAVSWIGVKCNVCGFATVQIDGGAPAVVDTFGPGEPGSLVSEPVLTASGLAPGVTHTLTIIVTGGGAAVPGSLTGSAHVAVDAFDVTK